MNHDVVRSSRAPVPVYICLARTCGFGSPDLTKVAQHVVAYQFDGIPHPSRRYEPQPYRWGVQP